MRGKRLLKPSKIFDQYRGQKKYPPMELSLLIRPKVCNMGPRVKLCHDQSCETCGYSRISGRNISDWSLETMTGPDGKKLDWRDFKRDCRTTKVSFTCEVCKFVLRYKKIGDILRREVWCDHCYHFVLCDNLECEICKGRRLVDQSNFIAKFVLETAKAFDKNGIELNIKTLSQSTTARITVECIVCSLLIENKTARDISRYFSCPKCRTTGLKSGDEFIPFERSCASEPFIALLWSEENELPPEKVLLGTNTKRMFHCPDCENRWLRSPADILHILGRDIQKTFCPCCSPGQICCGRPKEECEKCWNRSYANKASSKFFDYDKNYPLIPRQLTKSSLRKIWHLCPKKHSYQTNPSREKGNQPICPACPARNWKFYENLFFKFIAKHYGAENVRREVGISGCVGKKGGGQRMDGLLFGKIVLEVDGDQHYKKDVPMWKMTLKEEMANDRHREKCCRKLGYSTLRISQSDIKYNKNDWKENVHKFVKLLLEHQHHRHVIRCYEGTNTWEEYFPELAFEDD